VPGDGRCSARGPGSTGARGRFAAVISSDDRPAKPRRTARTGSFGTRTGRRPGGAVEAVTMRRSPLARPSFRGQAFERYCLAGSAAGRFVAFRGACRPRAVSWNHRDVGCRPPPASSPAIQDAPARRVRYFAEFVRGLGLHTFGLSGGHARPSGCAALRIDCDRLKGIF
jgi:hypothetical protein